MKLLKRLATVVVALPVAVAGLTGTAAASHDVTVLPGCWGGGTNATIICNLTVTVGVPAGVEPYNTSVPVCAGTCQDVPVTLVRTTSGEPLEVCYSYTNGAGTYFNNCYDSANVDALVDLALGIAQNAIDLVLESIEDLDDTIGNAWYQVCRRLPQTDSIEFDCSWQPS